MSISLDNFNQESRKALINSPRSKNAIARLGLVPLDLVKLPFDDYVEECERLVTNKDRKELQIHIENHMDAIQHQYDLHERRRKERIKQCRTLRQDIISQKSKNMNSVDQYVKHKFDAALKQERVSMMLYRERYNKQVQAAFIHRVKSQQLAEHYKTIEESHKLRFEQEEQHRKEAAELHKHKMEVNHDRFIKVQKNLAKKSEEVKARDEKRKKIEIWRQEHYEQMKIEKREKLEQQMADHAEKLKEIQKLRIEQDRELEQRLVERDEHARRNKHILQEVTMQRIIKAREVAEQRNVSQIQARQRYEKKLHEEKMIMEIRAEEHEKRIAERERAVRARRIKRGNKNRKEKNKRIATIQERQKRLREQEAEALNKKMENAMNRAALAQDKLRLKHESERLHEKLVKKSREEDRLRKRRMMEYQRQQIIEKNDRAIERTRKMKEKFASLREVRNALRAENENVVQKVRDATESIINQPLAEADPIEISTKIGLDVKAVRDALTSRVTFRRSIKSMKNESETAYLNTNQHDESEIMARLNKAIKEYEVDKDLRHVRENDLKHDNQHKKQSLSQEQQNIKPKRPTESRLPLLTSPRHQRVKIQHIVGAEAHVGGATLEIQKSTQNIEDSEEEDEEVYWIVSEKKEKSSSPFEDGEENENEIEEEKEIPPTPLSPQARGILEPFYVIIPRRK